ncbi:multidrug ABC transporter ATP-binding protein [Streptomyces bungoensis]|uniref:Multidrug ABC transporter ATP-binding protein n=1 Tax=Streptomyces bungoensis TaxID=285568 RepID=A0A117RB35_9ACTN|nr:ABC transporter ATP-binding protein [Streptomyces bungoensis]KUN81015.1 multidrug ABC transporter ATP-binding protein [Streptomyces bungoensis]
MIELAGVTKRYGEKVVVDNLTFTVRAGCVTGFLGPNGAGKSTTMRMMLGLDRPTSGRVLIGGRPYARLQEPLRHVGALLDAKAMHGGRSAFQNLRCLALSNGIPLTRVGEVLAEVGLAPVAKKRPKGFSLGMGQRLGIAAALLGDPEIVMLDEPVNGLDPEGIHWVRTLMKRLAGEGRTVFVSSHLMSEMALTADHLIVIGRGRLLADTGMQEFIDRNSRSSVRVRTPEPEKFRDVLSAAGITATESASGAFDVTGAPSERLGELALEHRVPLHELSPRHASLEEAFIALTGESAEYRSGPPAASTAPNGVPAAPQTTRTES